MSVDRFAQLAFSGHKCESVLSHCRVSYIGLTGIFAKFEVFFCTEGEGLPARRVFACAELVSIPQEAQPECTLFGVAADVLRKWGIPCWSYPIYSRSLLLVGGLP